MSDDLAERAYKALQESGPIETPTWEQLHPVERRHLIRFAEMLFRLQAGEPA